MNALYQLAQTHNSDSFGDDPSQSDLISRALDVAHAAGLRPQEKLLTAVAAWRAMARSDRHAAFELLDRSAKGRPGTTRSRRRVGRRRPRHRHRVEVSASCKGSSRSVCRRWPRLVTGDTRTPSWPGHSSVTSWSRCGSRAIRHGSRPLFLRSRISRLLACPHDTSRHSCPAPGAGRHDHRAHLLEPPESILGGWDLQFSREFALLRAELLLWDDRPGDVLPDALAVLEPLGAATESALSGGLFVLALRACADLAARSRQVSDAPGLARALAGASRLEHLLQNSHADPFRPEKIPATATADHASWKAEWARCEGHDSARAWEVAAQEWTALGRPHRAAYALWRQADALLADPHTRARSAPVLRAAARAADQHVPLGRAIRDLARRARIDLVTPFAPSSATPARSRPFGLTPREVAVVELVARGLTNRQIGAALYISTKTASVHVTNILLKMGVTSRVQAAAVAVRNGLVSSTPSD